VILPSTLRCRDHDDAPVGRPKGRRDGPERNRLTSVEYDGDNPLRLAEEIDAALDKYGLSNNRHMFTRIKFFEGELRLIANCLRCAGPQKVVKQPRGTS